MIENTTAVGHRTAVQRLPIGKLVLESLQALALRDLHRKGKNANTIALDDHANRAETVKDRKYLRRVDVDDGDLFTPLQLSRHDAITVRVLLQDQHRSLLVLADFEADARHEPGKGRLEPLQPQSRPTTVLTDTG